MLDGERAAAFIELRPLGAELEATRIFNDTLEAPDYPVSVRRSGYKYVPQSQQFNFPVY